MLRTGSMLRAQLNFQNSYCLLLDVRDFYDFDRPNDPTGEVALPGDIVKKLLWSKVVGTADLKDVVE